MQHFLHFLFLPFIFFIFVFIKAAFYVNLCYTNVVPIFTYIQKDMEVLIMSENIRNLKNGAACFTMNMDIACLDHGEGSFVCINNRLIISSVRSFEQVFALLDELEDIDFTYRSVFEIPAFMQWHNFKIAARNLEQLPIGTHMIFDNIKVVKVSERLVASVESDHSMFEFSHANLKTLCSGIQTESVEGLLINN